MVEYSIVYSETLLQTACFNNLYFNLNGEGLAVSISNANEIFSSASSSTSLLVLLKFKYSGPLRQSKMPIEQYRSFGGLYFAE